MKKLIVILLISIMVLNLGGCKESNVNQVKLVYNELSEKEMLIHNVTGNNIIMYELEGLPTNIDYSVNVKYVLYKNGEKVKESLVSGIGFTKGKTEGTNSLILNIQDEKISSVLKLCGAFCNNSLDIDFNLHNCTSSQLDKNINFNLNSEVYLYHAILPNNDNRYSMCNLGAIDKKRLDNIIKSNDINIFITLSIEKN